MKRSSGAPALGAVPEAAPPRAELYLESSAAMPSRLRVRGRTEIVTRSEPFSGPLRLLGERLQARGCVRAAVWPVLTASGEHRSQREREVGARGPGTERRELWSAHLVHLLRGVHVALAALLAVQEGPADDLHLEEARRARRGLARLSGGDTRRRKVRQTEKAGQSDIYVGSDMSPEERRAQW